MGLYFNPRKEEAREFLKREGEIVAARSRGHAEVKQNGKALPATPAEFPPADGRLMIMSVNNGHFEAFPVIYSEGELRDFTEPRDMRPMIYFLVDPEKVEAAHPGILEQIKERAS